jgi:hypothetical protein
MAQEDKGLVLRGLLLLGAIGVLVTIVLSVIFWRVPDPAPAADRGDRTPSAPGWGVRYNAATTLARRGSATIPWALLREMLDEKQQLSNFLVQPDGQEIFDDAAARARIVSALRAIAAWHEKHKADPKHEVPPELREIYAAVDKLAESPYVELKTQAEKTRGSFFR